ncbi:histidine kinase [Umezawaea sp. Da 62-37]|uniref:sensor histidine kinase n=1 Tax=Umezawaea sp. Da 62-37 TaxID=3075927 RepID=UPI0028F6C509|nr:histidine kinase [Umezawaea sp. Da 62-37]WNV82102.1 histidine kinase [Umezawaea sp. Da 62-37]
MDGLLTRTRTWTHGLWPAAGLFTVVLAFELALFRYQGYRALTAWAPTVLTCLFAVLSVRKPVAAACAAAASVLLTTFWSGLLGASTLAYFSPLSPAETLACMVITAVVVRQSPGEQSAVAVALMVAAAVHASIARDTTPTYDVFTPSDVFSTAMLLALAIGAGLYFRARDADRERSLHVAVSAAQQQERIALARELHDVVAHHVTGIVVQAQAALTVADADPLAAHRLLPGIARSGSDALTAMRRLVGTLRDEGSRVGAAEVATTDLDADLRAAVAQARDVGTPVELRMDLPGPVPPEVARSILRLVQESLTNVQKHAASATEVAVELSEEDGRVRLLVRDDGPGAPVEPVGGSGGYGLIGMRERVEMLGGAFSAGPTGVRGWRVLAELPVEGGAR